MQKRFSPASYVAAGTAALFFFPFPAVSCSPEASARADVMRTGQTVPSNARAEIDPFYLGLLDKGEKAFLAGNYREAASSLEVAVFGLSRRPDLIFGAEVRLAVSWHRLQNLEKSRAALLKVSRLMDTPAAKTAPIDGDALAELKEAAASLQISLPMTERGSEAPIQASRVTPPAAALGPVAAGTKEKSAPAARTAGPPVPEKKAVPMKPEKPRAQAVPNDHKTNGTKDTGPVLEQHGREKPGAKTPPVEAPEVKANPIPSAPEKKAAVKPAAVNEEMKAVPVTTEIELLESTVRTDQRNSQAAYRLCGIYFEQGRFGDARRVLRNLLLQFPRDAVAPFMLARAEYSLRNYAEALSVVRRMSDPANRSKLGRVDELRIAVYSALCLRGMDQKRSSASFYDQAAGSVSQEELDQLLREDGLIGDWRALKTAIEKRPVPGK